MRLPSGPPSLSDALQYLALRRKRAQQRYWACRVYSVVVASIKRLMER